MASNGQSTQCDRPGVQGGQPCAKVNAPILRNAMSVDVEDYFQVSAFQNRISRDSWEEWPCRVDQNVDRILRLFDDTKVHATFFILGWVAQRYPSLVRRVAECGHEIASHGMLHRRATEQDREAFSQDVSEARRILEDVSGQSVAGYRAPSYSIGRHNLWALDCLLKAGYRYSSSIYPVQHDHYGMPEAPRFAFRFKQDGILEVPVTTCRVFGRQIPCGGGGFFRLYPYVLSRWAIRRVNRVDRQPAIFYFHPWEIDPKQPRVPDLGFKARTRHYLNLSRMESRLSRLLEEFRWDRIDRVFPIENTILPMVSQPSKETGLDGQSSWPNLK